MGLRFTKGPWRIEPPLDTMIQREQKLWIIGAGGERLAKVGTGDIGEADTWDENARLIAAAPDMYAALSGALKILDQLCEQGQPCHIERAEARAALAKARGEE